MMSSQYRVSTHTPPGGNEANLVNGGNEANLVNGGNEANLVNGGNEANLACIRLVHLQKASSTSIDADTDVNLACIEQSV